jgi:hypothetical protein
LARAQLLVRTADPAWRELFDSADVISEGGVRTEADGRVWYGSTSMILRTRSESDGLLLAAVASRNVHVRLRAVRLAHCEASLRAPGRLGRSMCEIRIQPSDSGLRIDVDIQAPLIERRATARGAT